MSILDSQKIINHIPHWLGPTYARVRGWVWGAEDTWRDRTNGSGRLDSTMTYCDIYESRWHGCFICWVCRYLLVGVVLYTFGLIRGLMGPSGFRQGISSAQSLAPIKSICWRHEMVRYPRGIALIGEMV
jgi:hypothetical protein